VFAVLGVHVWLPCVVATSSNTLHLQQCAVGAAAMEPVLVAHLHFRGVVRWCAPRCIGATAAEPVFAALRVHLWLP
jgi:hypothetical protein